MVAWMRNECGLSINSSAERVHLARTLPKLPSTAAALAAGAIGFQHATVIARAADEVGADRRSDLEARSLEVAQKTDAGQLRRFTRSYRAICDHEAFLEDAKYLHAQRRLRMTPGLDGQFNMEGMFDGEDGSLIKTALDALMGPPSGDDSRTPEQRRADALTELARQYLGGSTQPAPQVGGQRAHLILVARLETVRREAQAPPAEIAWFFPIPNETLRRLSCDCSRTAVAVDGRDDPLWVGSPTRSLPPALRTALAVRDKGCCFPSRGGTPCGRPVEWCDGHHFVHWADGGPTNKANTGLLCRRHHRMVHEGGWRLSRGERGEVIAQPP
jgi:hypothetical protein